MIRVALTAATVAVTSVAVPANAANPIEPKFVVQTDSPNLDRGFNYFDTSLGTLQSVRIDVKPSFRRDFQILVPGQASTATFSFDASNEQFSRFGSCTNLVASGSGSVPLIYSPGLFGGSSYAYYTVNFAGPTVTSYLDPAIFLNAPFPGFKRELTQPNPGLNDDSLADIFQVSGGGYARNVTTLGVCRTSNLGCDNSLYTLTFSYAPGGVPEPTTWAMMMLGFGAMGFAMRRKNVSSRIRFA